jgi:hypothetical protein
MMHEITLKAWRLILKTSTGPYHYLLHPALLGALQTWESDLTGDANNLRNV